MTQNIVIRYRGWSIIESDGFYFYNDYSEAFETLDEIKDHIDYTLEGDYDDSEEQRLFEDHWQNQ